METLSSYTQMVQNEVEDTSARAKNIIERGIKDTYQEILRVIPEIIPTEEEDVVSTINQRFIAPTKTFQDFKFVLWKNSTDDTFKKLDRITEEDYIEKNLNSSSGEPTGFYINGTNVYFDIAPDNAGTVRIIGREAEADLTGNSIIPIRYTSLVVLGSVARFKAYEGLADANEYMNMYHGPYFEQGKIGGKLKTVLDEIRTHQPINRPKLFGK